MEKWPSAFFPYSDDLIDNPINKMRKIQQILGFGAF